MQNPGFVQAHPLGGMSVQAQEVKRAAVAGPARAGQRRSEGDETEVRCRGRRRVDLQHHVPLATIGPVEYEAPLPARHGSPDGF